MATTRAVLAHPQQDSLCHVRLERTAKGRHAGMLRLRVIPRFRGLSGLPFLCLVCCARFTDQQVETRLHTVPCHALSGADDEDVAISSTCPHLYMP